MARKGGWLSPLGFNGMTAEENIAAEQDEKQCCVIVNGKPCGKTALYKVKRKGFCKDHKAQMGRAR